MKNFFHNLRNIFDASMREINSPRTPISEKLGEIRDLVIIFAIIAILPLAGIAKIISLILT